MDTENNPNSFQRQENEHRKKMAFTKANNEFLQE